MLPLRFPNHGDPLEIGEVVDVKLDVFPQRPGFPPMEPGHIEQHSQFSVLADESLELGHKVVIIWLCQLSADVNGENLSAAFFFELNSHFGLLEFVAG